MHDKKGFTLIELLVVISIIALLVAILMPALNIARQQATGAVCLSNQKALMMGWVMYSDDNDGLLVGGHVHTDPSWYSWVMPPIVSATMTPLQEEQDGIRRGKLFRYLNAYDVYHCPGDKRDTKNMVTARNPNGWPGFRSFGIIGTMFGEDTANRVFKMSDIRTPGEKVVTLEETDDRGYNMGSWIMNTTSPTAYAWIDPLTIWHNKKGTLGYADGHAEMHDWVDKRTHDAAAAQLFNQVHTGSKDWEYMYRAYLVKRK